MTRSTEEWIGKDDDQPFPARVRLRILVKHDGRCAICGQKIVGSFVCDHIVAIINGGANRESNGQPICIRCDRTIKTPADVAMKSKTYAMKAASHGLKPKRGRPMPGSKASGWRIPMNGRPERRPP